MTSSYWFQSGDAPAPAAGGTSLRFRGGNTQNDATPVLTNSNITCNSTFTFSTWCKLSRNDRFIFFFSQNKHATANPPDGEGPVFYIKDQAGFYSATDKLTTFEGSPYFRDPSAWYHFMVTEDDNGQTLYVNGIEYKASSTIAPVNGLSTAPFQIGSAWRDSSYSTGEFYLHDVYFIDGQALQPTAFGEYDENDVWVPTKVYFQNTSGAEKYSSYLFVSNGAQYGDSSLAFNGDLDPTGSGTGRVFTDVGATLTWAPEPAVPFTTSLELYNTNSAGQNEATWDGNTAGATGGWITVYSGSGEVSANKPLVMQGLSGRAEIHAIRIDGELVNDPYMWSTQTFTSPGYGNINYDSTDKNFQGGSPVENGFNDQNDFVQCDPGNSWFFKPQDIVATKIEIILTNGYGDPTGGAFEFNGVEQTGFPGQTYFTVYEGPPISDWTLGGWYRPDGGNGFSRIRVNGIVLMDGINPSYGANGFHLDFSDPNNVGKDVSGNGNDFTPLNFDTGLIVPWQNTSVYSDAYTDTLDWTTEKKDSINPSSWINGFDGDLTTFAFGDNSSGAPINETWMQFRPPSPIQVNTSARIYLQYPHGCKIIDVNDNETTITVDEGNVNYWQDLNFTGLLKGIAVQSSTGYAARWAAIEIDGNILVSAAGDTYDLTLDCPTQNYATFNPLVPANQTTGTYDYANLAIETNNMGYSTMSCYQPTYFEFTSRYTGTLTPGNQLGDGVAFSPTSEFNEGSSAASGVGDYLVIRGSGDIVRTAAIQETIATTFSDGDVIGATIDDSEIKWYKNGAELHTMANPYDLSKGINVSALRQDPSVVPSINFGQLPFVFTPPDGYTKLVTSEQPKPSISNGRDHFQAITGTGSGGTGGDPNQILGNWSQDVYFTPAGQEPDFSSTTPNPSVDAPSANGFDGNLNTIMASGTSNASIIFRPETPIEATSSLRVYINNKGQSPQESIYLNSTQVITNKTYSTSQWEDLSGFLTFPATIENIAVKGSNLSWAGGYVSAIEVDGNILRDASILAQAQQTFPSGLWWIKDRVNNNQHQLVDSVRGGNLAINCPGLTTQAYTPPAGESVAWCWDASNPAKTGFDIVTYTGNGTVGHSIPHNLGKAPEFIITKERVNNGQYWCCYHVAGGPGYNYLNDTLAYQSGPMYQSVSDTDWTYDANGQVNGSGIDFVSYAWTSVPGYSAFGSYPGNGNAHGSFIYTGFKVAVLIVKAIDSAQHWMIFDSTRYPVNTNGATPALAPSETSNETTVMINANQVDFLSNGFKWRQPGAGSRTNATNVNYLYAAFAENPFSYPVTAR